MTITIEPQNTTKPAVDEHAVKLANEQAEGLRRLADLIQANPHLADEMRYTLRNNLSCPVTTADDQKAMVAAFALAATRAGAKVSKQVRGTGDKFFGIDAAFGPVVLSVWGDRDEVCERVVVGTREVTEEVPDPEALAAVPKVTVTKVVEDVEWVCGSLLAPAAGGGS